MTMTNNFKEGIVYNKDGQIIGYNISQHTFISLNESDVLDAIKSKALSKIEIFNEAMKMVNRVEVLKKLKEGE